MSDKSAVRTHFDLYANTWSDRLKQYPYFARFKAVERRVRKINPKRIADIGCGTGDYCLLFDPAKVDYVGIDISEKMVATAKALYPQYQFRVGDSEAIGLPDGDRDIALDVAVIEYYNDPKPHFKELHRVVSPGGTIIMTAPNGSNRSRQIEGVLERFSETALGCWIKRVLGRDKKTAAPGNAIEVLHNRYTLDDIVRYANQFGLAFVDKAYVNIRLLPESFGLIHHMNVFVSRCIEDRPAWEWLSKWTATILVVQLKKK